MKWLGKIVLGIVAAVVSMLAALQLLLPNTTCTVSEKQIDTLVLEKMFYDDAKRIFGCDGSLESKADYGEIVIETYAWRGAVWPYGAFEGVFVNHQLHGTSKTWLNLQLSAKKD
jgi:hypothetical protein